MPTHSDDVPYAWWERQTRNPWYDRETRRVVVPQTIKYHNNYTLTFDELKVYHSLLQAQRKTLEAEEEKCRRTVLAWEKGYVPSWQNENLPLYTLSRVMQTLVDSAKHKLAVTQFMVSLTQRMVATKKGETDATGNEASTSKDHPST